MKTLQEIKDEYGYEAGFSDWRVLVSYGEDMDTHVDDVAKRFALEVAKQTLENVSSKSQEMIYSRKMITRDILNEPIVLNQHCYAVAKHEILKETNIPEL